MRCGCKDNAFRKFAAGSCTAETAFTVAGTDDAAAAAGAAAPSPNRLRSRGTRPRMARFPTFARRLATFDVAQVALSDSRKARRLPQRGTRGTATLGPRRRASPGKLRDARSVPPLDACSGRPEHSRRAGSTADCSAWLGDDAAVPAARHRGVQAPRRQDPRRGSGPTPAASLRSRRSLTRHPRRRATSSPAQRAGGPPPRPYCQGLRRGAVAPAGLTIRKTSEGRRWVPRRRSRLARGWDRARDARRLSLLASTDALGVFSTTGDARMTCGSVGATISERHCS